MRLHSETELCCCFFSIFQKEVHCEIQVDQILNQSEEDERIKKQHHERKKPVH